MFMTVILSVFLLILIHVFYKKKYDYWSKRNVKHDFPLPLFGNFLPILSFYKSTTKVYQELYEKYPEERFVGYYKGYRPVLILRDPELIKSVLTTDFTHFYARGEENPHLEPMMLNLFSVSGDYWRIIRYKLSTAFSKKKLRNSFPLIYACSDKLYKLLQKLMTENKEIGVFNLFKRYTIEAVFITGFGVEIDALTTNDTQFVEFGETVLGRPLSYIFRANFTDIFPALKVLFGKPYLIPDIVKKTVAELVVTVRKQRNYKPNGCNDFMDVLIEMENKGKLFGESFEKKNVDGSPATIELDVDLKCIAAQVYVYFAAGFDTTSIAGATVLHFLAHHQEVQKEIQDEIDGVLLKYDNILSYDAVNNMLLLEKAIKEALRIFPPSGYLIRRCSKEYTFPGSDVTIEPGVAVIIPAQAIHMDKTYYENPHEFRPQRFSSQTTSSTQKMLYLSFGDGPRRCIGERMGIIQVMTAVATILRNYSIEPPLAPNTLRAMRAEFMAQRINGDLPVKFKPRNNIIPIVKPI